MVKSVVDLAKADSKHATDVSDKYSKLFKAWEENREVFRTQGKLDEMEQLFEVIQRDMQQPLLVEITEPAKLEKQRQEALEKADVIIQEIENAKRGHELTTSWCTVV